VLLLSLSIWLSLQRMRDAMVCRLAQMLAGPSVLRRRPKARCRARRHDCRGRAFVVASNSVAVESLASAEEGATAVSHQAGYGHRRCHVSRVLGVSDLRFQVFLSGCCLACNSYIRMLQVYVSNVLGVSEVCCKCLIWMFQM
jgi:hypothetical protein